METDRYALNHNYTVKDSRDTMEWIVNQKLAEWQIYNIDDSSDNYMSEDRINACIEYIIKKVITEMTSVQKDILSVGYPMETEKEMIESIKNRAKLATLNYAVQQNTPKEKDEVIANINTFD